jgi:hypothetical protein
MKQSYVVLAVAVLACISAVACAGNDRSSAAARRVTETPLDPGNFGPPGTDTNTWVPLTPGYQTVKLGGVNRGHRRLTHREVFTVTDVVKEIDGVRAFAVLDQDFDGGELAEQALDWLVDDKQGNVWALGGYTEAYEGGRYVNFTDDWLSGVKGARAGILIVADPTLRTRPWSQSKVPGSEPAPAEVVAVDKRICVPYRCFKGAVVIREGASETKVYVAGVGSVATEPNAKGGEGETERLINVKQLTPAGLAELSDEVLALDRHARSVAKDVYGESLPAARLG